MLVRQRDATGGRFAWLHIDRKIKRLDVAEHR
jgi:hypothetical protein